MSACSERIINNIESVTGTKSKRVVTLTGGDINRAARVETTRDVLFVKWNDNAPPGLFAAEAEGLEALRRTGTIRVPKVVAWGEIPAFLAMEFLEPVRSDNSDGFSRSFAEQLAALHTTPPDQPTFGYPNDNYLGVLPQVNQPRAAVWSDFYRQNRLLPLIELVRRRSLLPPERERLLSGVVDRLENLLEGMTTGVSLLHGDLWSGNYLGLTGNQPALVDPAVYYGPREMELGFIELFGGFPPDFAHLYRQIAPLESGYERRRPLHQLYPLLVHLAHFGETYGPAVERACQALR